MHDNETAISPGLAASLIAALVPGLAGLPLVAVHGGTDNVMFRIGAHHSARFPRLPHASDALATEARWLPHLAPLLPLAVPEPLATGEPVADYPFLWSVARWLPGSDAWVAPPHDDAGAGRDLARFVAALRAIPVTADAPMTGQAALLAPRDPFTRRMIAGFTDEADPALITRLWDQCLALPPWQGRPVWTHADLHPLNLLSENGHLTAVIDWGAFGAGDPAQDLIPAWSLLNPEGRATFRAALNPDPAEWQRGWALAFSKAIQAIPYYRRSSPRFHAAMRATLDRCLADWPA